MTISLWEPVESPVAKAKRSAYKLLVGIRAALILLASAWRMEPRHFRPGSDSRYKNLGWWFPMIPGNVYAWAAQVIFEPLITEKIPEFPAWLFLVGNVFFILFFAHFIASIDFVFHVLMCGLGRIFRMRESPPPYEFFLVRASGGLMWFAVSVCIMVLPILALRNDTIGYLASSAVAVPLIWIPLFIVAGFSQQKAGSSGWVGLTKMYQSERFVKFFWRIECSLSILFIVVLFFLSRHPDFLIWLLTPKH